MQFYRTFAIIAIVATAGVAHVAAQPVTVTSDCDAGATIANSLRQLNPGDTLLVTGTCNESVVIPPNVLNITLDGGGSAKIRGTVNGFMILGREITIRGFDISGGRNGITGLRGAGAVIDGNTIHDTGANGGAGSGLGINVAQNSYAAIVNNVIQRNGTIGILVHESSTARIGFIDIAGTGLLNTIDQNGTYGIQVSRGANVRVVGASITNNATGGILVERGSSAEVANNNISGNQGNGITTVESSSVTFEVGAATVPQPNKTDSQSLKPATGWRAPLEARFPRHSVR